MGNFRPAKLDKHVPEPLSEALRLFVLTNGLWDGLYRQAVNRAWARASGAARYTVSCYFRDGKLSVTLSSSVVRSQLDFQKEFILSELNRALTSDATLLSVGLEIKPVNVLTLR